MLSVQIVGRLTLLRTRSFSACKSSPQGRPQGELDRYYRLLRFLFLLRDLLDQELLRVAAGALDGAGIERIGQIGVPQRLEIAAAAAGLAELDVVLPCGSLVLGVLLLELHRPHGRERVVDVIEGVEIDV